jgi:hypothetical protein
MAANLTYHEPIFAVKTVSGNQEQIEGIRELAAQTFKLGTPVMTLGGFIEAWDGTTIALGISGFSLTYGANLASNGKGAPGAFGSVGAPGASVTYGSVQNQPSAVNIPAGAPFTDGRTVVAIANEDTIFEGQFDNSVAGAAVVSPTIIGNEYGMTIDASGQWYVDANKTTVGTNTVVIIVDIYPNDNGSSYGRVWFKVVKAAQRLAQ